MSRKVVPDLGRLNRERPVTKALKVSIWHKRYPELRSCVKVAVMMMMMMMMMK